MNIYNNIYYITHIYVCWNRKYINRSDRVYSVQTTDIPQVILVHGKFEYVQMEFVLGHVIFNILSYIYIQVYIYYYARFKTISTGLLSRQRDNYNIIIYIATII